MNALRLMALLIYTFGAFAYGAILLLWIQELGRIGWAGRRKTPGKTRTAVDWINGALLLVSTLWFVLNIVSLLMRLGTHSTPWQFDVALICVAYVFPPLIMHATWLEIVAGCDERPSGAWPWGFRVAYGLALVIPTWCYATFLSDASPALKSIAEHVLGIGMSIMFVGAAVYSVSLMRRAPKMAAPRQAANRSAMTWLYAVMVLIFLAVFGLTVVKGGSWLTDAFGIIVEISAKSLPLVFLFASAYYENRFQFFDIFVKRGLGLLMTIVLLTIWFAIALPLLTPLAATWAAPWVYAIAVVPVVASVPWIYARIGQALDRRWLGRRFSTVEAVTRFLSGLRSATTEDDLIQRAEAGLSEIFTAPALVSVGAGRTVSFDVQHETPVKDNGVERGRFVMGPRASDAPYFSQDAALLASLADVFASALENLNLQQQRLEEEQRAQEMSLHASRSELKALRAQINPHFLFNALNSIAGLIHRDPVIADRTIEKLADVFRYTLRGAEHEWAMLDDELEFVRAYLDVECARFGDRLQVAIDIDSSAHGARLPTMIVQTLVENAVKHGVATVRGHAKVGVTAAARDGRLLVSVTDNGPGFRAGAPPPSPRQSGGYGLVNIRERLNGYFGSDGALSVSREGHTTIVSLSIPLLKAEPSRALGIAR